MTCFWLQILLLCVLPGYYQDTCLSDHPSITLDRTMMDLSHRIGSKLSKLDPSLTRLVR
ncbi:hypothetical protein DSO57_1015934 [Entomophthora muscae]|uniref:Uncharacterized protein n=1 Tax=Entomophthora muscae TaxID=34485 RepID=A0ACC2TTK9_9FUNG|nr:hypothetical protein DSO57_1015934 [Entomophthora muscae]